MDPSAQLPRDEGFCDVVICPKFQPINLLGFMCLCRQHDDGSLDAGTAQFLADLESILSGQHEVEDNQVPSTLSAAAQGLLPVPNYFDLESVTSQVFLKT